MQPKRTFRRMKRRQFVIAIIALVALLLPATSAQAIVGGTLDGTAHPNVGIVSSENPPEEGGDFCNGVLIAPTIVLTAEGCVHRQPDANVSFAPVPLMHGEVFRNPQASGGYGYGPHGMAVIVLDDAVNVAPATLPDLSALNTLKRGDVITTVGYHGEGLNNLPPTPRQQADLALSAPAGKNDAYLHVAGIDGYPCADAGGGNFTNLGEDEILAAMTIYTPQFCQEKNVHLLRLDTQNSLEWLCSFDAVASTQGACGDNAASVQAASVHDGGKQSPDHQHKSKNKHGGHHRNNGKHRH